MNPLTINEQRLILETKISERALIIYVVESDIKDNAKMYSKDYKGALRDEIENHKLAIKDYRKELKQTNKHVKQ